MHKSRPPGNILQAATALVRRLSESKTSMVDIGKALRVSHAAFHRLYPSKAAIVDAIVQEALTTSHVLLIRFEITFKRNGSVWHRPVTLPDVSQCG